MEEEDVFQRLSRHHNEGEAASKEEIDMSALEAQRSLLMSLLEQNNTRETKILSVITEGGRASRDSFIRAQLKPLLETDTMTFTELLKRVDTVNRDLQSFGCYSNVQFTLQGVDDQYSLGRLFGGGNALTVQPVLQLAEAKRFTAKTGTDVGNGEGSGYINCQFRHMFGGAETLNFDASMGTRTKSNYMLALTSPINNSARWKGEAMAFATSRDIPWCSHLQSVQGGALKLRYLGFPHTLDLSVETLVRTISAYSEASRTVKFAAGDDMKRAMMATYTYDTRDVHVMPTRGYMFKMSGEYVLSANLLRLQSEYSSGVRSKYAIFNWGMKCGILSRDVGSYAHGAVQSNVHLMDRFYLGGANDVRGFAMNGLGPRDQNDSIGGALYNCFGLSVFTKVPGLKYGLDNPLKWHHFVNCGGLLGQRDVKTLLNNQSVSVGTGLVYNHPAARFELNICAPLIARSTDKMRKGLQFGVGVSFL
ncbi:SAM50-like protein SPAC17C9.06 [Yarrowia sp. B02]|nr:SAM50-like protein SPAC17C9.06 [Yarrowia sp. B02]